MHVNRLPGGEEKESVPEENLLRNNGRKLSQFVKRQKPTYSRSSANFKSINGKRFTERYIIIKPSKTKGKKGIWRPAKD